jgi:ribosomal protein L11 methyltransferase
MKYVELTIEIPEKSIETLTNILDEMGYPEVLINDPDEVKSLIDNAGPTDYVNEEELYDVMLNPSVTLYIECADSVMDATEKAFDIIDKLRKSTLNIFSTGVEVRSDDEWKDNWKEYFRPAKVTDRIVVGPVEEVFGDSVTGSGDAVDGPDEPEVTGTPEGAIRIGIDPGMAFGTGIHETTTLSLKLLEKYIKGGEKVLENKTQNWIQIKFA